MEHGGPKRIRVTWAFQMKNAEVFFDGARVASFATADDFKRGTTVKLPDGSALSARWGPVAGMPMLKGVHLVRNGSPVPGSGGRPCSRVGLALHHCLRADSCGHTRWGVARRDWIRRRGRSDEHLTF